MLEANISNGKRTMSSHSTMMPKSTSDKSSNRRNSVISGQIKQSNDENVTHNIQIAKNYSKIIHILVIICKIIIIASGLLSFSGAKFSHWSIAFASGSLNFLATSLLSYTAFLTAERKRITKSLYHKLVSLGIDGKLLISDDNISEKSV